MPSRSACRRALARSAAKTLAVAMLAVLAFMQGGPLLLVAALALSAVGDAFLSRDGEKAFLGGLASFLAAHILYVPLFLRSGGGLGAARHRVMARRDRAGHGGLRGRHAGALWRRVGPTLRLPIAVYVAAILAMGVSALTLEQSPGHRRRRSVHGVGRAACHGKIPAAGHLAAPRLDALCGLGALLRRPASRSRLGFLLS